MAPTKSELRAEARDRRLGRNGAIPVSELTQMLRQEFPANAAIGCYLNMPGEVSTALLISTLADLFELYAPAAIGDDLSWRKLTGDFQIGKFGIDEPVSALTIPVTELAVVIIPALAVDKTGNRLGFGAGYFDRNLTNTNALKIVLVYDEDIVPEIPAEIHDVKIDVIATPTQLIKISN